MSGNLPPGTTPADIDKHFGEPETERYAGVVCLDVVADVPKGASQSEIKKELLEQVDDERKVEAVVVEKI